MEGGQRTSSARVSGCAALSATACARPGVTRSLSFPNVVANGGPGLNLGLLAGRREIWQVTRLAPPRSDVFAGWKVRGRWGCLSSAPEWLDSELNSCAAGDVKDPGCRSSTVLPSSPARLDLKEIGGVGSAFSDCREGPRNLPAVLSTTGQIPAGYRGLECPLRITVGAKHRKFARRERTLDR